MINLIGLAAINFRDANRILGRVLDTKYVTVRRRFYSYSDFTLIRRNHCVPVNIDLKSDKKNKDNI